MAAWEGAESVILIDAAQSGAAAGTIHRFDAASTEVPSGLFHYSSHQFAVAEAIEMARVLGRLPGSLMVFGIEGTDFSYGEGLSPAVSDAIDKVENEILAILSQGSQKK
jgi:hydrogenase maturation protease